MCLVQMLFLKLNSIEHTLQHFTLSAILAYVLVLTKKKKHLICMQMCDLTERKKGQGNLGKGLGLHYSFSNLTYEN